MLEMVSFLLIVVESVWVEPVNIKAPEDADESYCFSLLRNSTQVEFSLFLLLKISMQFFIVIFIPFNSCVWESCVRI